MILLKNYSLETKAGQKQLLLMHFSVYNGFYTNFFLVQKTKLTYRYKQKLFSSEKKSESE